MAQKFRHLDANQLIKTVTEVTERISEQFPHAGLREVAQTVVEVTRESVRRADWIQQPDWRIRGGLLALALVVLAVLGITAWELKALDTRMERVLEFARALGGATVYLGAVVVFFVTLETRLKRARAVKALHELRALAHIIDMHQLPKGPDRLGMPADPKSTDGLMSTAALTQYLRYCTDLLAIISKIGQLYIQDFPDGTTLETVDQFENLATGLSQKIWQKIMILDQLPPPAPRVPPTTPTPPVTDGKPAAPPPSTATTT